ncbi:DNA-binding transcriptional repressor AcrR [Clavibacter michiganensis]|nr:DNA-binding transcriptional repressor AcrR [Clavibacter michiganensis]
MTAQPPRPDEADPSARRRRGSYAGTDARRAAILEAALVVFARDGYRGGSLKIVADQAGMTDAGILHHFRTKTALLAAVLELRDARSEEVFTPFEGDDPHRTLLGLVDLARYNSSTPGLIRLHATLSAEATSPTHPAHEYFVQRYRRYVDGLARTFAACAREGTLRPSVEPVAAAHSTIAVQDGLQLVWLLHGDEVDLPGGVEAHLRRLVDLPT